jgi:hypothetical protein
MGCWPPCTLPLNTGIAFGTFETLFVEEIEHPASRERQRAMPGSIRRLRSDEATEGMW